MASFDYAIPVVLKHEGGYCNIKQDKGGATNFGISTLIINREGITAKQLGIPDLTPESIKLMKVEAAEWVYETLFWNKYHYSNLSNDIVATKILDCGVNCGPSRSHRFAQEVVGVAVDGILGPKSIAAINAYDPKKFILEFCAIQLKYYQGLVAKNPSQSIFLKNWTKRSQWGSNLF